MSDSSIFHQNRVLLEMIGIIIILQNLKLIKMISGLLMLLFVVQSISQYTYVRTIHTFASAVHVAVSPYNGNIVVGNSNGSIAQYTQNGDFVKQINDHKDSIIDLIWTTKNLISIDRSGYIVCRNSQQIDIVNNIIHVLPNPISTDASKYNIGINYGNQINIIEINSQSLITQLKSNSSKFIDFSFSRYDDGIDIYVLTPDELINYGIYTKQYTSKPVTIGQKSTIRTSANQDMQIINNKFSNSISEWYGLNFNKYYNLTDQKFFEYSYTGFFIFAIDVYQNITIWKDSVFQKQLPHTLNCEIMDIDSNFGVLAIVDTCGYLQISFSDTQYLIPFWVIILIGIIVIIGLCAGTCVLFSRLKKRKHLISEWTNTNTNTAANHSHYIIHNDDSYNIVKDKNSGNPYQIRKKNTKQYQSPKKW